MARKTTRNVVSASVAAAPASPAALTPPASMEAEQAVLGAILLNPPAIDQVSDLLTPQDFYRQAHATIYEACLNLYRRGEPVDLTTVATLLKERGQLEEVGGPVFLATLSEHVGTSAHAYHYARLRQGRRRLSLSFCIAYWRLRISSTRTSNSFFSRPAKK